MGDEKFQFPFRVSYFSWTESKASARQCCAVFSDGQREAVSPFLVGLWHEIGLSLFFGNDHLACVEWNVCVI
jgi:hypothetical protein